MKDSSSKNRLDIWAGNSEKRPIIWHFRYCPFLAHCYRRLLNSKISQHKNVTFQKKNSLVFLFIFNIRHIRPGFFTCWITFHFQEFQSAAKGRKIKIEFILKMYSALFVHQNYLCQWQVMKFCINFGYKIWPSQSLCLNMIIALNF